LNYSISRKVYAIKAAVHVDYACLNDEGQLRRAQGLSTHRRIEKDRGHGGRIAKLVYRIYSRWLSICADELLPFRLLLRHVPDMVQLEVHSEHHSGYIDYIQGAEVH